MADTQEIKDKIDIVDLIREYIDLKQAGTNFKACCPFHKEKTPSFMVSRERQRYHCFGCNKDGDIFTFIQDIEGMDFVETLNFLANRAGVVLTRTPAQSDTSEKTRIKEVNSAAANFFYNMLVKMDVSTPARDYLKKRGLSDNTIIEWMIGYIPDQWDLLTSYLLKKGFSIDDLVASGLTIKKDNSDKVSLKGYYDRFRGRIMFPIWDVHDNVVGFTGRVLVETDKSGGKYVNTPQTSVYDKSRVIFGLNKAKREIKAKDFAVVVEGQMDVIACHQAGMKNVVASSGTAFTEKQILLLKRYSNNLKMAFDADAAGQNAAKRGIDIALQEGMNVKVIMIPNGKGKDPDECIKNNKEIWFHAVTSAQDVMKWYFEKSFADYQPDSPSSKQKIANIILPEIARIPYAVESDYWLQELAERLKVDISVLRDDLKRIKNSRNFNQQQIKDGLHKQDSAIAANIIEDKKTKFEELIDVFLMLLLTKFNLMKNFDLHSLESVLSTSQKKSLYEAIKKHYTNNTVDIDFDKLYNDLENENKKIADLLKMRSSLFFSEMDDREIKELAHNTFLGLKEEWLKTERKRLENEISSAEKRGDKEMVNKLLKDFQLLVKGLA
jgi:DNA primase